MTGSKLLKPWQFARSDLKATLGKCKGKRPSRSRKGRRRPAPRFRQPSSQGLWSSHECLRQICTEARKNKDYRQPLWTIQTFKQAYRKTQQSIFAKTGKFGCLSVYAARNGGLLALWTCQSQSGSQLDFRQFLRSVPPERAVVRLARLVQMVQGYVKQTRGFRHVDKLLHRFRMPSRSLLLVSVFFSFPSQHGQGSSAHGGKSHSQNPEGLSCTAGSWSAWNLQLAEHHVFLTDENAVQAAKAIRISSLWQQGVLALDHWRRGVQVRRLPGNWDIIDRAQQAEEQQTLGQEVKQWMREKFILKPVTKACYESLLGQSPAKTSGPPCWRTSICGSIGGTSWQCSGSRWQGQEAHMVHAVGLFSIHPCGSCAYGQSAMVSSRDISPQDLSKLIYESIIICSACISAKRPLCSGAPLHHTCTRSWRQNATHSLGDTRVKRWATAVSGKLCLSTRSLGEKLGDLPVGPCRYWWFQLCRFFSLGAWKTSSHNLKLAWLDSVQLTNPISVSIAKVWKNHTTMLIADAAQMYEQVSPTRVIQAFDRKASILQEKYGASTITESSGKKTVVGWPGGSEHTRSGTYVVFTVIQLRRMLTTSCSLCFATLGDIVVQSHGLLIGGLLSMIAAVGMLSEEEEHFPAKEGPWGLIYPRGMDCNRIGSGHALRRWLVADILRALPWLHVFSGLRHLFSEFRS